MGAANQDKHGCIPLRMSRGVRGWFSNMHVEYLDAEGNWQPVEATVTPALPESDAVFIQPHFAEFVFEFEPVETTASLSTTTSTQET